MFHRVVFASLVVALSIGITACGSEEEQSGERLLTPHLSPVPLGEFMPLGGQDADPLDNSRTPYEWNLMLHAPEASVTIDEACLVDSGDGAADEFVFEGPEGSVASRGDDSVIRLTYERQSSHSGDEQDDIAVVVYSDAVNAPTIVVPVCARVVDELSDNGEMECNSPIDIPADGESVDGLCG